MYGRPPGHLGKDGGLDVSFPTALPDVSVHLVMEPVEVRRRQDFPLDLAQAASGAAVVLLRHPERVEKEDPGQKGKESDDERPSLRSKTIHFTVTFGGDTKSALSAETSAGVISPSWIHTR